MKLMKNWFWKPWNTFTQPPKVSAQTEAKITIAVLLKQEMPDRNHPLPQVIWVTFPGDLGELWKCSQPGHPDKIALFALNSAIFSSVLLSASENEGQTELVDVVLNGTFSLEIRLPQSLRQKLKLNSSGSFQPLKSAGTIVLFSGFAVLWCFPSFVFHFWFVFSNPLCIF